MTTIDITSESVTNLFERVEVVEEILKAKIDVIPQVIKHQNQVTSNSPSLRSKEIEIV